MTGTISWYFLTDSYYHIDFGDTVLYEFNNMQLKKHGGFKYSDYWFGYYIDALLDHLPLYISKPIPHSIFQYFKESPTAYELRHKLIDWFEANNENLSEEETKQYLFLDGFIGSHFLDTSCYRVKNHISFFRVDDQMYIQYDFIDRDEQGDLIWNAGSGTYVMPYSQFVSEVTQTVQRFFEMMVKQINEVKGVLIDKYGKGNTTDEINNLIHSINEENKSRKQQYYKLLENFREISDAEYFKLLNFNDTDTEYSWESIEKALLWALDKISL